MACLRLDGESMAPDAVWSDEAISYYLSGSGLTMILR